MFIIQSHIIYLINHNGIYQSLSEVDESPMLHFQRFCDLHNS